MQILLSVIKMKSPEAVLFSIDQSVCSHPRHLVRPRTFSNNLNFLRKINYFLCLNACGVLLYYASTEVQLSKGIHTLMSQNIMTWYAIGPLRATKTALTRRLYNTSKGALWYLAPDISNWCFKSCKLRGRVTVVQTCSSTSHNCSIRLRYREFGGQGNILASEASNLFCKIMTT